MAEGLACVQRAALSILGMIVSLFARLVTRVRSSSCGRRGWWFQLTLGLGGELRG